MRLLNTPIGDLVELLGTESVLMFRFYLDESGHSEVVAIAGFMIHAVDCPRFEREWKNVLLRFSPTVKEPFHMNEFSHPKIKGHQFSGWPKEKLDELMGRLLRLICKKMDYRIVRSRPRLWALGCAVETAGFSALPEVARKRYHNDPWYLAFETTITLAAKWLDEKLPTTPSPTLGIVFDRKTGFQAKALEMFNRVKDSGWAHRHRLGETVGFSSLDSLSALQAADLLVYEIGQDLKRKISGVMPGNKPYEMRYPLQYMTKHCPIRVLRYDDESFRRNLWYLKGEAPAEQGPEGVMKGIA